MIRSMISRAMNNVTAGVYVQASNCRDLEQNLDRPTPEGGAEVDLFELRAKEALLVTWPDLEEGCTGECGTDYTSE